MDTAIESVCCREVPVNLDHLMVGLGCITMHRAFRMLCGEREVLEVAMLSLRDGRAETLERPINSNQVTRRKQSFPLRFPLMRFRNISVKTDSLRKRNELYKRCSTYIFKALVLHKNKRSASSLRASSLRAV
ncbi:unnamed protein product [Arctogadus glacialis]